MEYFLRDVEEKLLNKKDFIEEVSHRSMLTKYVIAEIYNLSYGIIAEKLISGEAVELPNLGKFEIREKKAKNLIATPDGTCVYPAFKIGNALKNRIKNGHKYKKTD